MCKYHKLLLAAELIFCSNPKSNVKIPLAFCRGNQGDANFRVGLQRYVIPAALCHVFKNQTLLHVELDS